MTSKYELLFIAWIDSQSGHGWEAVEHQRLPKELCESVGYLILEDKNFIMLASSYDPDEDAVNNTMTIPKVCIKERVSITKALSEVNQKTEGAEKCL